MCVWSAVLGTILILRIATVFFFPTTAMTKIVFTARKAMFQYKIPAKKSPTAPEFLAIPVKYAHQALRSQNLELASRKSHTVSSTPLMAALNAPSTLSLPKIKHVKLTPNMWIPIVESNPETSALFVLTVTISTSKLISVSLSVLSVQTSIPQMVIAPAAILAIS